jgi:hypothetical protein
MRLCNQPKTPVETESVMKTVLAAYRFQYIVSGVQIPRFRAMLNAMITPAQALRVSEALAPIMDSPAINRQ